MAKHNSAKEEKQVVNQYETFDRIAEDFHMEMEAFSKSVAVQLAKTSEKVINTPWVDIQKREQEKNRRERSKLRPIPRMIPNSIEER